MKFHAAGWAAGIAMVAALIAGCEPDTVWSPDSKVLALDPHGVIVTYDLSTKKFQQRTIGPEQALNPTWSPDGKQILYFVAKVDKGDVKGLKLSRMDLATGMSSALPCPVPAPAPVKTEGFSIDLSGRIDIARETLTAAYSPDGKKIAYTSYFESKTGIWIADASGAGAKRITSLGKGAFRPVWSPDSSHLAYFAESPEEQKAPADPPPAEGEIQPQQTKHRLEMVNTDGTDAKVLWAETHAEALSALGPRPEWAADSKSLLVATDDPRPKSDPPADGGGPVVTGKLWTVLLEGEPKLLGTLPGPTAFTTFSGSNVAFFHAPKDMNEKDPHLFFMAPPYDNPRRILQIPGALLGVKTDEKPEVDTFPIPTLSPDSKTISLIFVKKAGPVKLVLFPLDGRNPASLDVPIKLPGAIVKPKAPAKKPVAKKPASTGAKPKR